MTTPAAIRQTTRRITTSHQEIAKPRDMCPIAPNGWWHYSDVIMGTMASQISSLTIVYWTVYSGTDERLPAQRASNAENVSFWWRHHETYEYPVSWPLGLMITGDKTAYRFMNRGPWRYIYSYLIWISKSQTQFANQQPAMLLLMFANTHFKSVMFMDYFCGDYSPHRDISVPEISFSILNWTSCLWPGRFRL